MQKLIECVPNISEGRDRAIIDQVTGVIEEVESVKLLDVDPGADTNRTVITFIGPPDQVGEAAFKVVAVQKVQAPLRFIGAGMKYDLRPKFQGRTLRKEVELNIDLVRCGQRLICQQHPPGKCAAFEPDQIDRRTVAGNN